MKFGETLLRHARPGLRYLDYAWLKKMIEADQKADFLKALLTEVGAVDRCFEIERQRFEMGSTSLTAHELRTYAVLNYLACLKIAKKHDKQLRKPVTIGETLRRRINRLPRELPGELPVVTTTQQVERALATVSFCKTLHDRKLFACADCLPTTALTAAPTCAVCLETMPSDHAVLACNHRFCWGCVTACAARGIRTCPLCRAEQSLEPVEIEIEKLLGESAHSQAYFPAARLPAPLGAAAPPPAAAETVRSIATTTADATAGPLRVMTWNVCAIAFPFTAPTALLLAGALLGCSWHDVAHDTSLLPLDRTGRPRLTQQAKYIVSSGADVVFLQEVCGRATLDELMRHLTPLGYEASYARRAPSVVAVVSWVVLCLAVAATQLLVLVEPAARLLVAPHALAWLGGPTVAGMLLRWLGLAAVFALRWRDSLPAQFLLGSIAGQLVMLRRIGCATLASELMIEEFVPFDYAFMGRAGRRSSGASSSCSAPACSSASCSASVGSSSSSSSSSDAVSSGAGDGNAEHEEPAWRTPAVLQGLFSLRARGVLRARVPVRGADGEWGVLRLLTTHLPHCTDNTRLMRGLAAYTREAARDAHVVLGGDWNSLPDTPVNEQLAPLLGTGGASLTLGSNYADVSDADQCTDPCTAATSSKEAPPRAPAHAAAAGALAATGGADEGAKAAARLVTWDQGNPLTRLNEENPCDQHLDFMLVQPQANKAVGTGANIAGAKGASSSLASPRSSSTSTRLNGLASTTLVTLPEERFLDGIDLTPPTLPSPTSDPSPPAVLETLETEVVLTPLFFVPGAPLSDHYGIATNFRVTRRSQDEGTFESHAHAD